MFAEVLTFAGTVSGKLLIGGAVAAASITGAQASGLVDVPGLPDKTETVVVADETIDDIPAELPLEDEAEKPNRDETGIDEAEDKATTNDEVDEFSPEKPAVETDDAKDETDEPAKEDDKAEEPKVEEPKAEEAKKNEDKPEKEEPSDYERAVTALEEQLHKDKEAEYAAATELIKPLEADKKALVKALEERLGELERARNEAKAPLYEELETTEDPDRRAEIEAELSAIFEQWELDRDAAIAEAGPAIGDIEQQLETIELERDAEIERLIQQFRADVEALQK